MTWPEPDAAVARRMRAAHACARAALGVRATPGGRPAWGWRGRTLGQPVSTAAGPAWLRLAAAPVGQIAAIFWDGNIDAEKCIPSSIPRPRLRCWHDWTEQQWTYRAELYNHATAEPVAISAAVTAQPDLPQRWWMALRSALDAITATPTSRMSVQPSFLDWVMPRYLGRPIDIPSPDTWTTAHGDLHLANLCGPDLCVLDWEGWGIAPPGYDAAMLHSYSLLVPTVAAQIRTELRHLIDNPTGRLAELVVISELLHAAARGTNRALATPLRRRAVHVLGREVPSPNPS